MQPKFMVVDDLVNEWNSRTSHLMRDAVRCSCGHLPMHVNHFSHAKNDWVAQLKCIKCKIHTPEGNDVEDIVAQWNLMQLLRK